jgi:hypothetical protein
MFHMEQELVGLRFYFINIIKNKDIIVGKQIQHILNILEMLSIMIENMYDKNNDHLRYFLILIFNILINYQMLYINSLKLC